MDRITTNLKFFLPQLGVEEQQGLQDYWDIYEAHREQIDADLMRFAIQIPEFKSIMENPSFQQTAEQQQTSRERQRRAVYEGAWEPYLENLWEQGRQYAQAGIPFRSWFELVSAFRRLVRPHILDAFSKTPDRMLVAMMGADLFVEIAMTVIGESYLHTKEELISQQQNQIQKVIERAQTDERFRGVLEAAPDAIVVVNNKGEITLVNSQFEQLFGYRREEIIGQRVEKLVPGRFHLKHPLHRTSYFQELRVRPMGTGLELFGLRKDGREFPVEISLSPLQTNDGTLVTAAIRDVTERKLAEEKINRLNVALEHRALDLEASNKELEAFSYSVSHDLRAPLRTIDGFSAALIEDYGDQLNDEGRNYLLRIRTAAQRMAQLIDDLLNLSRLSRAPLNIETINLSAIAQNILHDLRQTDPQRIVDTMIAPNLTVRGDPRLMRVVLENLLSNAWKFTARQPFPRIEFGLQEGGADEHVYFVRDNGAGFDMAYVNKLFGVFQRLHTVSEFPGIGIGLAIVQRIIQRHGGKVWAEGTIDGGAAFYFTL
jgi:PAS domain S-box-containing protein